ncbi:alpha/beta hydrolase [Actinoplanes palleronii]|uniref:Esterase n=1 Tax=Actinoplanes palleronii TaxID=113570 RepID=A0ABQ4BNG9_9ACTN|nr:alpha/beta hydrolase [Actinoplanes palleronii]GIE71755.1 esterase [Actinoplanes palleronii]
MPDVLPRPPFDPELGVFLTAMHERGPLTLTTDMLPRMRALDLTEQALDDRLKAHGWQRRTLTVPGYQGAPINLAVISRIGRTGPATCFYTMHGGGMMFGHYLGNLDSYDDWLLVHDDVVLVSVDYRLAPEHPDPYPVEDCYAGLLWTATHGDELGIDPARIVLVGQSAGGGLAAGTALLARDRQGPPLFGQILISPMLDDSDSTVSTRQIDGVGIADRAMTRFGWTAYLGGRRGGDDVSIYAAPARATDLTGMPPTYIDCASAEVFRDETVAYASGLWHAGIDTELHVWPGGFHGFTSMMPQAALSRAATAALATWTARLLAGRPAADARVG